MIRNFITRIKTWWFARKERKALEKHIKYIENHIEIFIAPWALPWLNKWFRYKVSWGGRAAGRTMAFAFMVVYYAATYKNKTIAIYSSKRNIEKVSCHVIIDWVHRLHLERYFEYGNNWAYCTVTGTHIIFAHSQPDKLRGMDIDYLWIDEGQLISQDDRNNLFPIVRNPESEIWISFSFNTEKDQVFLDFVNGRIATPQGSVIHTTFEDNPWFTKELDNAREQDLKDNPVNYARNWLGRPY